MTQWEYRIVENSDAAYSQIAEMLNDLGSQGWELVSVRGKKRIEGIGKLRAEPGNTEPDRNEPTTRTDDPIATTAYNHQPPHQFIPQSSQSAQ